MKPAFEPSIIYEDENFLAVNKPRGMLVHGSHIANRTRPNDPHRSVGRASQVAEKRALPRAPRNAIGDQRSAAELTLVDWLLARYPQLREVGDDKITRPGIVHRLDRETSGVMLVAKTQSAFDYLKSLFQKHEIKKTYLALAEGEFTERVGTIDMPIGLRNGTVKRTVHGGRMVKDAVTRYEAVREVRSEKGEVRTLLRVHPQTGRTHQIRVHLAGIGHPIAGDALYGRGGKSRIARRGSQAGRSAIRDTRLAPERLMLHALSIEFAAPGGKRMKIEAEAPEEFNF